MTNSRSFLTPSLVGTVLIFIAVLPGSAHPRRGSVRWSVILCTFTDSPAPPHDRNFYANMFFVAGMGGMADYWSTLSKSGINFQGSDVVGWYQEPFTIAQAQAQDRWTRFQSCVSAAQNSSTTPYTVPSGNLIAVVTSPGIDLFAYIGYGSFLPDSVDMGGMTHEAGHGLGYQHSFSNDPNYRNAPWAQIGEYDDQWDAMSWANAFPTATPNFGFAAPGMNGPHLDEMGWLRRDEIFTFGADAVGTQALAICPLYSPMLCVKLIRIPFDPSDLFHYYTVEYRTATGYDAGIPGNIVMIHEVKKGDRNPTDHYLTYLLKAYAGNDQPVQSLSANGVTITVNPTPAGSQYASVTISSDIVGRCVQGYVWREAGPADHVCVTGDVRAQAQQDNAQAASRRNPSGGPYGPDTCLQGFVWREAFPGDHVCVTGDVRSQAANDNSHAAERINPARFVYGPNTCQPGYVWREADAMDYVCVTGTIRDQTRIDNILGPSRRNPGGGAYGPDTCAQGYVWREAFPGDHVCVTPDVRSQAAADNSQASARIQIP